MESEAFILSVLGEPEPRRAAFFRVAEVIKLADGLPLWPIMERCGMHGISTSYAWGAVGILLSRRLE